MIGGPKLGRWREGLRVLMVIVFIGGAGGAFGACERNKPSKQTSGSASSPEHRTVKVEVLNGCGVQGIARRYAELLRQKGFDVVNGDGGNAENFGFLESVVVDRAGDMEKARAVAQALGIRHCVQQIRLDPYRIEEVTVIIGKDFDRLASLSLGARGKVKREK